MPPNTALHRTPAAAPPSPVSSKPFGARVNQTPKWRPIPMNRALKAFLGMTVLLVSSCGPAVSTNAEDYVGEYAFLPRGSPPGNFASLVILRRDQTAMEIRFSRQTGEVSPIRVTWHVSHTTGHTV